MKQRADRPSNVKIAFRALLFCFGTYLFWFCIALIMEGFVATVFIFPMLWNSVFELIADFWVAVWPAVSLGTVVFAVALILLWRSVKNVFVLTLIVNTSSLIAFLTAGEARTHFSINLDAVRIDAICLEQRSFTRSMLNVGLEYKPWHAWAVNEQKGIHLWSYRDMSFVPAPATKSPYWQGCLNKVKTSNRGK